MSAQLLWPEQLHLGQGKPSMVIPCPYQAAHRAEPAEQLAAGRKAMKNVAPWQMSSCTCGKTKGSGQGGKVGWCRAVHRCRRMRNARGRNGRLIVQARRKGTRWRLGAGLRCMPGMHTNGKTVVCPQGHIHASARLASCTCLCTRVHTAYA